MSEVIITVKDIKDGDKEGVIFGYEIVKNDGGMSEDTLAVKVASLMTSHAIEVLEITEEDLITNNEVH